MIHSALIIESLRERRNTSCEAAKMVKASLGNVRASEQTKLVSTGLTRMLSLSAAVVQQGQIVE